MGARTMTLEEANRIAQQRIADLEAENKVLLSSDRVKELEGKASQAWETCQQAVERGMKIEAENRTLREIIQPRNEQVVEWAARYERLRDAVLAMNPNNPFSVIEVQAMMEEDE